MDFCYFIGIDIAKDTLDWAVFTQQGLQLSTHGANTLAGIKTALAEFKALPGWNPKLAVFCMEHTGLYNAHLLELLDQQKLAIWLESSLQIKQAGGMQRGKTAAADRRQSRCPTHCSIRVSLPRSNAPLAAPTRGYSEIGLSQYHPPAAQSGRSAGAV